ncbi:MAG: S-adenosylmethionine decarboxylase family protein [Succiniclasticum sp.]
MKSTGMLIAIDMYNCKEEHLEDSKVLSQALFALAEKYVMAPHDVQIYKEKNDLDYALFIACYGGHITFHIYPDRGYVGADVFTIDETAEPDAFARAAMNFLDPDKLKVTYVQRQDYGSRKDMKPRHRTRSKTINRMHKVNEKLKNLMLRPRSM